MTGSRGGGKTDAGIAWLLDYTDNPNYRALVLRRNAEDLKDWVDRANQLYSQLTNKGTKVGNPPEFKFESGAIIRTGHLKDDQAYTKYQGHEYHKILIEELTHIPDEKHYLRLLSSARSVIADLRPQVFLTTNPGGKGHMWVKERFVDPAQPGTTIWESGRSRVFIPATMDDNPTLMTNDPQYVANIEALKESDPETYRAWRFGDWEVFAGQVFREFKRRTHVLPKPTIPAKSHTHVLWGDWGYSQNSAYSFHAAAIIRMQTDDGQKYNQIIVYKEWYGNETEPKLLARIIYNWYKKAGIKPQYGVTDPAMHSRGQDGRSSIAKLMEEEWKNQHKGHWIQLVPGKNTGNNGRINRVGMLHAWFSQNPATGIPYLVCTPDCVNAIRTIPNLVYDEHLVEAYDTDQEDHCLHPDTVVITFEGPKKIKDIEGKSGKVLTVNGTWADYHDVRVTRKKAELVKLLFSDGYVLKCTPDHKILTPQGMMEAQYLQGKHCVSMSSHQQYKSLMGKGTTNAETTFKGMAQGFTESFGSIISAILNLALIFITKITIEATMVLKTSLRWMHDYTFHTTVANKNQTKNTSRELGKWQVSGINLERAGLGIKSIMKKWPTNYMKSAIAKCVIRVKRILKPVSNVLDSVNQLALLNIDVTQGKMMLKKNVLYAEIYSVRTNTLEQVPVQDHALIKCVGVKKIEERADTYDLTVDTYHCFAIENGVVVHNCADDWSYGLEKVKFVGVKPGQNSGLARSKPRVWNRDGESIGIDLDKFATIKPAKKQYFT